MSAVSIICLVLVAAVLLFPIVFMIKGAADKRKATRPVSFYAPRGFSPIDVMAKYSGKKAKSRDLFSALMLYWAERGFITVEEDCKRGLKLTKLKPLTPPVGAASKSFAYEQKLFNTIFCRNDVFYTLAATDAYGKDYNNFMSDCESAAENVATQLSRKLSLASLFSSIAMLAVVTIVLGIASKSAGFVAGLFPFVGILFMRFSRADRLAADSSVKYFMYPFFAVWSGLPGTAVVMIAVEEGGLDFGIVYAVAVLVTIIVAFWLSGKIDLRSAEDLKYYGEIDAFKTFLVQAEKDKLELLVEDDPEYFYNVLPYFYVLGITDKMKAKFDRIVMDGPSWYLGDLRDTLMF